MKTILLLLVLFSSKLSGATFSLHFVFDSDRVGQELSVQFEAGNFTSPISHFDTMWMDWLSFQITTSNQTILFHVTDPALPVFEVPFNSTILGPISIQTSLYGRDFSPDIYLNGETSFSRSVSEGEVMMQDVLFADHMLSGELQNFSMERGKFEVRIFSVPESRSVCVLIFSLLFLLHRNKTQKPAP